VRIDAMGRGGIHMMESTMIIPTERQAMKRIENEEPE
jgi:hypothetical protein